MPDSDYAFYLPFAHALADKAGAVIRGYFRTGLDVETKADASPVTLADKKGEVVMREMIMKAYPAHGIWGEEFGKHNADAEYVWVLDPVDGTLSFIAGLPTFGTLISLVHKGSPVLGVIDQPISKERWAGIKGGACLMNGATANVCKSATLAKAVLSTTSPDLLAEPDKAAFYRVRARAQRTLYGYDCYAYAQLASGHIHTVIETGLKPHDFCALAPVVESAGGVFTDWNGTPVTLYSEGKVIAAANAKLHAEILKILQA